MSAAKLSEAQRTLLRKVSVGHYSDRERPYQLGNTNRTADNLERRGLIVAAPDQSQARKTFEVAWIMTDAGREALK